MLVFGVLFVHSLPEGFAIGTAYASDRAGPRPVRDPGDRPAERARGDDLGDPHARRGVQPWQQFWAAVLTSAPQPVGAIARVPPRGADRGLLPVSFAFAAGAMLSLVAVELVPQAFGRSAWLRATAGSLAGAALMVALGGSRRVSSGPGSESNCGNSAQGARLIPDGAPSASPRVRSRKGNRERSRHEEQDRLSGARAGARQHRSDRRRSRIDCNRHLGISNVRDNLKLEQITGLAGHDARRDQGGGREGRPDRSRPIRPTSVAGETIDTGSEARVFASYMRIHALEATGGQTLRRDGPLPRRERQTDLGRVAGSEGSKTGQPVENGLRNLWVSGDLARHPRSTSRTSQSESGCSGS